MEMSIDPTEIKSIKSSTPVTITFNDGNTLKAYSFVFEDAENYVKRKDKTSGVNLNSDLKQEKE